MTLPMDSGWQPSSIRRFIDHFPTSAGAILVATDKENGYLKAMGNPAGEHALACEWVGTQLARWFGLPTFDYALIDVADSIELHFAQGGYARPGPAFITRAERRVEFSGTRRQLKQLINPEDLTRLVIFDTWTRNWDRYAPNGLRKPHRDNVFLSEEAPPGKLLLRAMDHTECFTQGNDLTRRNLSADKLRDPRVYGLFPEFKPFLDHDVALKAVARLQEISGDEVSRIVQSTPPEWDVSQRAREALVSFLLGRARFVAEGIIDWLWPQGQFEFMHEEEREP